MPQLKGRPGLRLRQFLLTCALVTPLMFAIISAPPFSAETRAQSVTRMFGPRLPAQVGNDAVAPTRVGNTIRIDSRWACGSSTNNVFTLSNPQGGIFRTVGRTMGPNQQSLTISNLAANGTPTQVVLQQTGATQFNTTVAMADFNGDGVFDGLSMVGSVTSSFNFVFLPGSEAVSIPWATANLIGVTTTGTCAGDVPQVWIPLTDTNGDGRGDSVVFDLDGDGVADADLVRGPVMALTAVPSMGAIGRLTLLILLGLIGAWFLSRRGHHDSGSPAPA